MYAFVANTGQFTFRYDYRLNVVKMLAFPAPLLLTLAKNHTDHFTEINRSRPSSNKYSLLQRWASFGLDAEVARQPVDGNDFVNADLIVENSTEPNYGVPSGR